MSQTINVAIESRTLTRLLQNRQLRLEEIHCQDIVAHREVHDLLLQLLKSHLSKSSC